MIHSTSLSLALWLSMFIPMISGVGPEACPKISGLADLGTTYQRVQSWLQDHKDQIQNMNFKITKEPLPKGVLPSPSMKRLQEKETLLQSYEKRHITNEEDFQIRSQLDMLDKLSEKSPQRAHNKFKKLYEEYKSPRALFGMATTLNKLALEKDDPHEARKLQGKGAAKFCQLMSMDNIPLFLYMSTGRTCIELRRHRKERRELIAGLILMRERFPNAYEYTAELALEYLKKKQLERALELFKTTIKRWPVKAGKERILCAITIKLIRKQNEDYEFKIEDREILASLDYERPVKSYLLGDLAISMNGLLDAFTDSGNLEEANFISLMATDLGLFASKWQKQLLDNNFYIPNMNSKPVWPLSDLPQDISVSLKEISSHWSVIRKEGLRALFGNETDYEETVEELKKEGRWQQLVLYEKGLKNEVGCDLAPKTCQLVEKWMPSATSCTRGQIKFSVIQKG